MQVSRPSFKYTTLATGISCCLLSLAAQADSSLSADTDGDGLIDIASVEELDAIRYELAGKGQRWVENGPLDTSGCPQSGCFGYELVRDLNFDTNADGQLNADDLFWNDGAGWQSIGDEDKLFSAVFDGNGYVIRNLMLKRNTTFHQGLFGRIKDGVIRELGLRGPLTSIDGYYFVGGLAGQIERTRIESSYVISPVRGDEDFIGGLVGQADTSTITDSYFVGPVDANGDLVGALTGRAYSTTITNSFAVGRVTGREVADLIIGSTDIPPVNTYWSPGANLLEPVSSVAKNADTTFDLTELKCPTAANDTACSDRTLFQQWGAAWAFRDQNELPGLKLNGRLHTVDGIEPLVEGGNDASDNQNLGSAFSLLWLFGFLSLGTFFKLLLTKKGYRFRIAF